MKFFIDSADIEAIKKFTKSGMVDGVTTNPSIIAKSGRNIKEVISEICGIVNGPVSAEVTATKTENMIEEGKYLSKIANNVAVKVPLTWDGLETCKVLSDQNIMVNVTLCFSSQQALLAAKAGATFISPFIGRLDDIGEDGMELIKDIRNIYDNYPNLSTEILAASIRSLDHVKKASLIGADIATLPPSVLEELALHPLTDIGLKAFLDDWEKSGQKIM
ncbi:MAG: fructose-6-phosphate aldolase [Rhizobiales bacterium TMED168]|nr:MAG: fructose-6-phosphate aldolase [Rhizobiales bacterium TMED168]|tara:strand:- start:6325 stop:6981 length:657 start_codon:yes stop_codon:yes gene_type:complete